MFLIFWEFPCQNCHNFGICKVWKPKGKPKSHKQCSCFQFLDGANVACILRQSLTQLATLFQGSLKIVASRHKCGDTLPKKKLKSTSFRWFFTKIREMIMEYSTFKQLFWQYLAKKITGHKPLPLTCSSSFLLCHGTCALSTCPIIWPLTLMGKQDIINYL
jgi:hypothetical protein